MTTAQLIPDNGAYNPFIFFDDKAPDKIPARAFCKVYHDGGHFIAMPYQRGNTRKRKHERLNPTEAQEAFDGLYFYAIMQGYGKKQTTEFIKDNLCTMFDTEEELTAFIDEQKKRKVHNLHARKKRFRRKAFLNKWTHFITITYDDKKHTEAQFKQKLRRCLCNLHTRRGWRYMGVFERAPETGRLHFHALLFVPNGEMIGEIYEKQDYSTKQHKMQTTHENTFFAERYGRNDFAEICPQELQHATNYVLKYLEKSGERVTYSRGIPAEIYKTIHDSDIVCTMRDFCLKYILFDNVIDYETDVLKLRPSENLFDISPRWLC